MLETSGLLRDPSLVPFVDIRMVECSNVRAVLLKVGVAL